MVAKYYPVELLPQKTFYALEEIITDRNDNEATPR